MKNLITISLLLLSVLPLSAHDGGHGAPLKEWTLAASNTSFKADFIRYDNHEVWLRDAEHKVRQFNLSDFSPEDQRYILERNELILALNTNRVHEAKNLFSVSLMEWLALIGCALVALSVFLFAKRKKRIHIVYGVFGAVIIGLASCSADDTAEDVTPGEDSDVPANDLSFMESLFESFTRVTTSSDETYFYVASNGLPDHAMMVGITNWQQQVPIPQDYTGGNSWAVPIQPALAAEPLSTETRLCLINQTKVC